MTLWNRKPKAEQQAPPALFDFQRAEKDFLSQYEIQSVGSTLCVRSKGGQFRPLKSQDVNAFLRTHLIQIGRADAFRRDLCEDFTAWLKGGL